MTPYEFGYAARIAGCHRVLANPANDAELAQWQRGWDAADDKERQRKEDVQDRHENDNE